MIRTRPDAPAGAPLVDPARRIAGTLVDLARRWRAGAPKPRPPAPREVRLARTFAVLGGFAALAYVAYVASVCDAEFVALAAGLPRGMVTALGVVTRLGTSGWMLVTAAVVFAAAAAAGRREIADRAVFFFLVIAGSGIAAQALKHLLGRARPLYAQTWGAFRFDLFSWKASLASMPSGHATTVAAAALILSAYLPRARWAFVTVAVVVAFSRFAIGAHYLSDVLAGAALGIGLTLVAARACARRGVVFGEAGVLTTRAPAS